MDKYNLEDRTTKFAINIVFFVKKIKKDVVYDSIINQLIRAGTSVGANYCEANGASSRNDFRNKIYICKKEIQETKYWLKILGNTNNIIREDIKILWKEAQELSLIFGKITSSLNNKKIKI